MRASALWALALFVVGCTGQRATYDLSSLEGKATVGMTELQVVQALGVPSHITKDGDYRDLRYDSKDGKGSLVVGLKSNVVIIVERRD